MMRYCSRALYVVFVATILAAADARAQDGVPADEVKAAFLANFAGFVTWPDDAAPKQAIVIGVMEADEVEAQLRRSLQARTHARPIVVRHVENAADLAGLHILFVGTRDPARMARMLALVQGRPILTVTENGQGIERGGIINLVTTDRVQFEVSLEAAAKARLQLNSRLLGVAMRVKKGEGASGGVFARAALPANAPSSFAPAALWS